MSDPSNSQLDWTAFCYVADELSPAEKAEFEQLLAVDQQACEAVVSAMQMCEALAELPLPSGVAPRTAAPRRVPSFAGWAAVAVTAACVLIAVAAMLSGPITLDSGSQEAAVDHDANQLIGYWRAASGVVDVEHEAEDMELAMEQVSFDEGVVVPDWLFAAVSSDAELERSLEEAELQHN